ncbi:proteasome accessory factor PafA2 family protein [Actinomyces vulturis]|uniref:proteasome accessory factor PafA2 family protein n=1 Tax=Actinomyces vulturis TaxID=1857645 RepID=UPI000831C4BC|nr:proteasome accessory factor PafA2 family protein [Actinomyces vulturis]
MTPHSCLQPSSPPRRVVGVETEFALRVPGHDSEDDVERAARRLFRFKPAGYRGDNLFLSNGGRLYLDVGAHPEYATAECGTVKELLANDRAGRAIVAEMAKRLHEHDPSTDIHLIANNVDSIGHTYGCHESYSFSRAISPEKYIPILATFLAVRPLLTASGAVRETDTTLATHQGTGWNEKHSQQTSEHDESAHWCLSARSSHLHHVTSADTTGARALVNTRDEPHGDAATIRRVHMTSADTTMSPATLALRTGLTLLLLDAIEDGEEFSDLIVDKPLDLLHAVAASTWGTEESLTIMEAFLNRLTPRVNTGRAPYLDGLEWVITDLAPRVITALATHSISGIDTEIDWAIKRRIMIEHHLRHRTMASEQRAMLRSRIDVAYHDEHPRSGLFAALERHGQIRSLVTSDEVDQARTEPPQTRAAIRGAFVSACIERGADFAVSWESIRLDSPPTSPVDLPDPCCSSVEKATKLINIVKALSDDETHWIDDVGKGGLGAPG